MLIFQWKDKLGCRSSNPVRWEYFLADVCLAGANIIFGALKLSRDKVRCHAATRLFSSESDIGTRDSIINQALDALANVVRTLKVMAKVNMLLMMNT